MSSYTERLTAKKLATPPPFIKNTIQYECIMGSMAYGVSSDNSDMDLYGWCVPPKNVVFPHLNGEILGFDKQKKRFEQYLQHHIHDKDGRGGKGQDFDIQIFNIVKYFRLCLDNNPNMLDSLFVPQECITHITQIGQRVRENRHTFLHKGLWSRLKGYSYSQFHKMQSKNPQGKRKEVRDKYGFDLKFAMHAVRLLNECEQLLSKGDLDLRENNEQLKAIRRGEVSEKEIRDWYASKEKDLETLKANSKLPEKPQTSKIKTLLISCLEQYFGSLEGCVADKNKPRIILDEIKNVLVNYGEI